MLLDSGHTAFYGSSYLQKSFLSQLGAVHLSAPVYQVVSLVDQEQIIPAHFPFSEKAAQIGVRVKNIIVIADDHIGKKAHVQSHLKGTDLIFFCIFLNGSSAEIVPFGQQRINGLIYPVKMPFGPGTCFGIAIRLIQHADLFSGRKGYRFALQIPLPHQCYRILSYRPCYGLSCKVKDLLRFALSHGLYCRKQGGDGLAGSGRCFQKKLSTMHNGPVAIRRQFLLALPVWKREAHGAYGGCPSLPPLQGIGGPFPVLTHDPIKPSADFLPGHAFIKIAHFLRI